MIRGSSQVVFRTLVVVLLAAVRVQAEEAEPSAVAHSTEIFRWINFALVLGAVVWVFLKVTPAFFRRNATAIGSAIDKALALKSEADRQLGEAQEKLAHLEREIAELRAAAQREGVVEAERIRQITKMDAERIAAAAQAEIRAAERAARLELKIMAANLAVDGAEALLSKQLTAKTQESLVSAFVDSLAGSAN